MINQIHQRIFRPDHGWDPVPASHMDQYGKFAWEHLLDECTLDWIETLLGPLAGKKVLDLGGGPGQYSVALALRGSDVTWHDISAGYRTFAKRRAEKAGVRLSWSLGYLEDAQRLGKGLFDLIFCRSCWYYCVSDRPFAGLIYELAKPGGCVFINTPVSQPTRGPVARKVQRLLYEKVGFKIGHPMPPPGHVARLFQRYDMDGFKIRKIDTKLEEEILFRKPLSLSQASE